MRFDFDPHTATTYTATVSTQIGPDLTAAAQAASDAATVVPSLGLIGADFRTQLIATITSHAATLSGYADTVNAHADHLSTYQQAITGLDTTQAETTTALEGQLNP